jgi:hypothetical protein
MLIFHVISLFFLDGTGRRGKLKFILNQISEVEILAERTGQTPNSEGVFEGCKGA